MLKSALTAALTLSVLSFMPASVHGDALPATKLLPILVEADEFKVYLDEDRAVWRGNVAATQGKVQCIEAERNARKQYDAGDPVRKRHHPCQR